MITFRPAILPSSGEINKTRWREYPTPKRERDGYTIAQYKYDKGWCDPYYRVYFNSNHINHPPEKYDTLDEAIEAANNHNLPAMLQKQSGI